MAETDAIEYYWRPGCPFCMMLDRSLAKYDLPMARHNIWDDQDAANYVKSVANGNETVPTVRVGEVAMVNPSAAEVLAAVGEQAPELLPDGVEAPGKSKVGRFVNKMLGGEA